MSDQYFGEIRRTGFNFAPPGWALCQGQLLSISQNAALFSLLGTVYGGDGRVTFALPNLCGRLAIGTGFGAGLTPYSIGSVGGQSSVTLSSAQMPSHTHLPSATSANGGRPLPTNDIWTAPADSGGAPISGFNTAVPNVQLPITAAARAGGSQPMAIMQPYLTVNYIIALTGEFPQRP